MFDAIDRAWMVEELGEPATLPDGSTVYIIPDEHNKAFTTAGPGGEAVRVYPNVLMTQEDVDNHGIVDGDAGTVITLLGRQSRVISIVKTTDGFYNAELGEV